MNLLPYLAGYLLGACLLGRVLGPFLARKEPSLPGQLTIKLDRGCRLLMAVGSRMGYRVWVN